MWTQEGEGKRGVNWWSSIDAYTLLGVTQTAVGKLLHSTWRPTPRPVMT